MSEKYEFIDAECATLPADGEAAPTIVQMCGWLGVSKSGFHDWRTRPQSETAQRRELLKIRIKALFEANNSEYGYRRIHAALVRGAFGVGQGPWASGQWVGLDVGVDVDIVATRAN